MLEKFSFNRHKDTVLANSALCYIAAENTDAAVNLLKDPKVLASAIKIMKEWREKRRLKKFNVKFGTFLRENSLISEKQVPPAENPPAEEVDESDESELDKGESDSDESDKE